MMNNRSQPLLGVVFALALVGCGSSDDGTGGAGSGGVSGTGDSAGGGGNAATFDPYLFDDFEGY